MKTIVQIVLGLLIIGFIGSLFDDREPQRPVRTEYIPGGGLKCIYSDGYVATIKSGGCPSL